LIEKRGALMCAHPPDTIRGVNEKTIGKIKVAIEEKDRDDVIIDCCSCGDKNFFHTTI
jgi:hypothetical protein